MIEKRIGPKGVPANEKAILLSTYPANTVYTWSQAPSPGGCPFKMA